MKQIILVEDDEPITEIFEIVFGNSYGLTCFQSGEKIMESQFPLPDLFILDRQISGTNGLDICRFIKNNEKFKNVPVIMLSAHPDILELAMDAGADDAIAKPFSLDKLKQMVTLYIEK